MDEQDKQMIADLKKQVADMTKQLEDLSKPGEQPQSRSEPISSTGGALAFGGIPFGQMKKITPTTEIDKTLFRQVCVMTRMCTSTPKVTPLTYDGKLTEWASLMRSNLAAQGIQYFIENKFTQEVTEMPEFELLDRQAHNQIVANIHASALHIVTRAQTARECWDLIHTHYHNSRGIQAIRAFNMLHKIRDQRIDNLKELIKQYTLFLNEIEQALGEQNSAIWHEIWTNYFFTLVPPKFNYMVGDVKDKFDSVHKMLNHFKSEELLAANAPKTFQVSNLKSKLKHPERFCEHCKKQGHTQDKCYALKKLKRKEDEAKSKSHHSTDHSRGGGNLNANLNSNLNTNVQPTVNANLNVIEQSGSMLSRGMRFLNGCLRVDVSYLESIGMQGNSFIIPKDNQIIATLHTNNSTDLRRAHVADSGAATGMSNRLEGFISLREVPDITATTAEGRHLKVLGIGSYLFRTRFNVIIQFDDVLYIPELESTFVAIARLDRLNFMALFGNLQVKITKDGELVIDGNLIKENLYILNGERVESAHKLYNVNVKEYEQKLSAIEREYVKWHKKLIHPHFESLIKMKDKLGIKGIPSKSLQCASCAIARMQAVPYPLSNSRTTGPLQLIHSDISGKISISNPHGYRYFGTFVDDYSRFRYVFFLKKKSDLKEAYFEFERWCKRKLPGTPIRKLRSDNGGEYIDGSFVQYLISQNTDYDRTIPDSPQQNGVAERSNRVLVDAAKTALLAADLPGRFWVYAIEAAGQQRNKCPSRSIDFEIPEERMFGKPAVYDEKVHFGERVTTRDFHGKNKFSPNGNPAVVLSKCNHQKGHNIYLPQEDVFYVSRGLNSVDRAYDRDQHFAGLKSDDSVNELVYTVDPPEVDEEGRIYHFEPNPLISVERCEPNDQLNGDDDFQEIPSIADEQSQSPEMTSNEHHAELKRLYPDGLITLNKKEKREFEEKYKIPLKYQSHVKNGTDGKKGKLNIYRIMNINIPTDYLSAVKSDQAEFWNKSMLEEVGANHAIGTFEPVKRTPEMKVLPLRWVYSAKTAADGSIAKYRARLVVKGCSQRPGIDYTETYAPVIHASSTKFMLAYGVKHKLKGFQLDVKRAFLNASMKDIVYVSQIPGFPDPNYPTKEYCFRLTRAVYGTKQAARAWNDHLVAIFDEIGLVPTLSDPCIFKPTSAVAPLVGVHVDDMHVLVKNEEQFDLLKGKLAKRLELNDLGPIKNFLSMEIEHLPDGSIHISQRQYIRTILERFGMSDCNPVPTPALIGMDHVPLASEPILEDSKFLHMLGSVLFLATITRADILFVIARLCRYMQCPRARHMDILKRVLRYLKGTIDYGLRYSPGNDKLTAYCDADFSRDRSDGKSISGVMIFLGDNLIYWSSRKQHFVATSTCEAEILSVRDCISKVAYFVGLAKELGMYKESEPVTVYNDNMSANCTLIDGGSFDANCHYKLRINFIIDMIKKKIVKIMHLEGASMRADLLTKPLAKEVIARLLQLCNFGPITN